MLSFLKITLIITSICSLNVPLNSGFTFPILQQQQQQSEQPDIKSLDDLKTYESATNGNLLKRINRQEPQPQYQLGGSVMPPIFDSYSTPFVDLSTKIHDLIKMFNDVNNPMMTDDILIETDMPPPPSENTTEETNTLNEFLSVARRGGATKLNKVTPKDLKNSQKVNINEGSKIINVAAKKTTSKTTEWPISNRFDLDAEKDDMHFHEGRITLATDIRTNYIPKNFPQICKDRSTIYNKERVRNYGRDVPINDFYVRHDVDIDLRRAIYNKGVSEMCHTEQMSDFFDYIRCAIKRNMRMESVCPQYPKIQLTVE